MHYVEVLVAGATFHGNEALTYSTEKPLRQGTIVRIPLRNRQTLGIVFKSVDKPSFAVKLITDVPRLHLLPEALQKLILWMKHYYPSPYGTIVQQVLPKDLPKKTVEPIALDTLPVTDSFLPPLTADQAEALEAIQQSGTFLLHGSTGTGKTRVYIELAQRSVSIGKSCIILTPEIGLTSQLAQDFRHIFGQRVVVIHSQLTEVTRERLWVSLLEQEQPVIVIGPRSALFSPLHKIGFIAVDEAHDAAYKQNQAPYYHASRVAAKLAEIHGAPLVLGSATPLVTDYYMAKVRRRPIIRMKQTATGTSTTEVTLKVIDLKDRSHFTRKSYLSDKLIAAIEANLERKEQTLLFLNRRGTARVVFCDRCGWQSTCPHCDLPLVYHSDAHTMRCHTCNFTAKSPVSCPECHNSSVVFKSIGTKAIVDDVKRLFPEANIKRFDNDNKKHERIEQHYDSIKAGEVDILIGTQTIAKGLDLPKLSLVGVVIADTSLYFPDFSAQERTYQLLTQVIGRVGRGHRAGTVILQTYTPESILFRSIINKEWGTFYTRELDERKSFLFPPFCHLLTLSCRRATSEAAQTAALACAAQIVAAGLHVRIDGPAPSFHEKVQNKYQWQLVIKSKDRSELLKVIALLPSGWSYDIDPINLL